MQLTKYLLILLLCAGGLISCKKNKVSSSFEPSKWEQISGTYKVYDTTGVYLYEMKIMHIIGEDSNGKKVDSLRFSNFDNQFSFTKAQSNAVIYNWPKNYFYLGTYNPIRDKSNKRWRIMGLTNDIYNSLVDGEIKLRFDKNNILYYISDLTPYFSCVCKQVAVKQ